MVVVEGVARSLDPNANIWSAAAPVVENWMRDNLGPKAVLRDTRDALMVFARLGPRLPEAAERLVALAERPPEPASVEPSRARGALYLAAAALAGAAAAWAALSL